MATFVKDPNATLDYVWDWSTWLTTGETITTHTCTGTGVTVSSSSHTGTTVTAWVTGGTGLTTASVTCHVVTSAGRADDRTLTFDITDR